MAKFIVIGLTPTQFTLLLLVYFLLIVIGIVVGWWLGGGDDDGGTRHNSEPGPYSDDSDPGLPTSPRPGVYY